MSLSQPFLSSSSVCGYLVLIVCVCSQEIIDADLVNTLLNASKANERCEDLKNLALSTISKITNQFGKDEVTETAEDEVAESTAGEDDINA
ncbi:hypothetical protein A2U01_0056503 [Trifolium medium]|uniref:Uncharacterized protein n=1 Tax=Trifolium medium TaxID=97028 RepID=A0A392RGL3_9FABA|nr:hypothetical protein [Trifolium medium]